jgi:hypothetical protein
VTADIEAALAVHRTVLATADHTQLVAWQFGQQSGSAADLVAHWSVMRNDPGSDTDRNRRDLAEHVACCVGCQAVEAVREQAGMAS